MQRLVGNIISLKIDVGVPILSMERIGMVASNVPTLMSVLVKRECLAERKYEHHTRDHMQVWETFGVPRKGL